MAVKSVGSDKGMGHDVWFKRVWKSRFMIEPSSYHQRVKKTAGQVGDCLKLLLNFTQVPQDFIISPQASLCLQDGQTLAPADDGFTGGCKLVSSKRVGAQTESQLIIRHLAKVVPPSSISLWSPPPPS